jgi:hypothetical protein
LLQKTSQQQVKGLGENNPKTMDTMYELAEILMETGRYQEAKNWCEKLLHGRMEVYEAAHDDTRYNSKFWEAWKVL